MKSRPPSPWRACLAHAATWCGVLVAVALCTSVPANAVLGGPVDSIQADQLRMHGQRRQAQVVSLQVQMHEITLADGSSVRQYVLPSGIVFAVVWSTRFKPNLELLLGTYAASYASAASDALKTPGIKRHVLLQRDDWVVQSTSHLNSFVGRAYLRSLVPEGVNVHELR